MRVRKIIKISNKAGNLAEDQIIRRPFNDTYWIEATLRQLKDSHKDLISKKQLLRRLLIIDAVRAKDKTNSQFKTFDRLEDITEQYRLWDSITNKTTLKHGKLGNKTIFQKDTIQSISDHTTREMEKAKVKSTLQFGHNQHFIILEIPDWLEIFTNDFWTSDTRLFRFRNAMAV